MNRRSLFAYLFILLPAMTLASGLGNSFGSSLFGDNDTFLPVDKAFSFTTDVHDTTLRIQFDIADGYYLYQKRFSISPVTETLTLENPVFVEDGLHKNDPNFGEVVVYHNRMQIEIPFTAPETGVYEASIRYQGCAERGLCYPPETRTIAFNYDITDTKASSLPERSLPKQTNNKLESNDLENNKLKSYESADSVFAFIQQADIVTICGIFFLLGLGLTFTPCVFPMIPIITSIIGGNQQITSRHAFVLAFSYVTGMAATYAAAGVITGLLGASANIQAYLQSPPLLITFSAIFGLLALSMFGLYELQLPAFIRDRLNAQSQQLHGGHILSVAGIGALSALVVSPCVSAPLAGALLYISSTGEALVGGLSLLSLGFGMGVPLIIVAVSGHRFMPKAGHWMNGVKAIYGVLLLGVSIWLLERIIPAQVSLLLWSILIGLSASQLGAFEKASYGAERLRKGLALLLALYAGTLFIGALTGAKDPFNPLQKLIVQAGERSSPAIPEKLRFDVIGSVSELDTLIGKAQSLQKPLLIDFYADWCISCKVMEKEIFDKQEVQTRLKDFILVKADVTANTPSNQQLLEHFNLFGPPGFIFFNRSGKEIKAIRQMGEITKEKFLSLVEGASI